MLEKTRQGRRTGPRIGVRASWGGCSGTTQPGPKAWQRAGLQPHRFERYMVSDDPDFEQKAADVLDCT